MTRGEIWWADLGPYRTLEQTGRRPVIVWQSDTLTRSLQSVLVVPVTTNLSRARLAGSALVAATDGGLDADSVALAFQMRAIPKKCLKTFVRALTAEEVADMPASNHDIGPLIAVLGGRPFVPDAFAANDWENLLD